MFQPMKRSPADMPGFQMPEIAPLNQQLAMPAPAPKKRGMFAGATIDLNAALAGFAAGMGNPAGAAALQNVQRSRQMAQQQQADEDQYQRRQADGWDRWVKEQQYKLANPEPRQPYRWESNDGSLMELGADGQPRVAYKDPTPKIDWVTIENSDGSKTLQPRIMGGMPQAGLPQIGSTIPDPRKMGGASGSAPTPTFR